MIRFNRFFLICLFLAGISPNPLYSQEEILNYENSLKFARYLLSTNQYDFAQEEYEKINFFWPGDSTGTLELVKTYRLNRRCDMLGNSFMIVQDNIFKNTSANHAKEYLNFALSCKSESDNFFTVSSLLTQEERSFYDLSYYWMTEQYDQAFTFSSENAEMAGPYSARLYRLTEDFKGEKYKSPALAAAMSVVLPGSGKLYSKKPGDAVISFLFVASNAYASYRAFNKKGIKSVNGWIFGGLAFSYYSAGIWGSSKAAKRYNSDLKKRYQDNAENIIYNSF
jgi:hypothetical protein